MPQQTLVSGQVILDDAPAFTSATVYIRVEEISRADAPARIDAAQVIQNVSHIAARPQQIEFAIYGDFDPAAHYNVRVHVDIDGDGQTSPGDLITMESYPILTHGYPAQLTVHVRPVT